MYILNVLQIEVWGVDCEYFGEHWVTYEEYIVGILVNIGYDIACLFRVFWRISDGQWGIYYVFFSNIEWVIVGPHGICCHMAAAYSLLAQPRQHQMTLIRSIYVMASCLGNASSITGHL